MARPNPILYQNVDADMTLMDIPASIVAAQGDRSDMLLSTAPLEAPLQPKEHYRPKAQKAKAKAKAAKTHHVDEARYKALVEDALAQIRTQVSGPWCTRRKLMTQRPVSGEEGMMDVDSHTEKDVEARMREWASWNQVKDDDTAFSLQQLMASLSAATEGAEAATDRNQWTLSYRPAHEAKSSTQAAETDTQETQTEPWTCTFYNPHHYSLAATISKQTSQAAPSGQGYGFTIPPLASLFLSDTTASDGFRTWFRRLTDEHSLGRHFDLMVLDPPWPNRSAKRKGAYEQVGGVGYLKKMLVNMDLDMYLEHNALVGVWITNKASLRDHVLGGGGLFEMWNVGLMEEWIWVKTTTQGEPMFDMDNGMRKPYEILLLGRAAPNSWTRMVHAPVVKRRVIAAVPDIHSRKPCLKALLEPFLVDSTDYSALEVFSRYLVSGWTSWGNEVLKYNWEGYWDAAESVET